MQDGGLPSSVFVLVTDCCCVVVASRERECMGVVQASLPCYCTCGQQYVGFSRHSHLINWHKRWGRRSVQLGCDLCVRIVCLLCAVVSCQGEGEHLFVDGVTVRCGGLVPCCLVWSLIALTYLSQLGDRRQRVLFWQPGVFLFPQHSSQVEQTCCFELAGC